MEMTGRLETIRQLIEKQKKEGTSMGGVKRLI